jgi:hypothetical protein
MSFSSIDELRNHLTGEAGYEPTDVDKWLKQFVEQDYTMLLANPIAMIESFPITAQEEAERIERIRASTEKYGPEEALDLWGPGSLED